MKREPESGTLGNLKDAVAYVERENEECGIRDHDRARDAEHEGKSERKMKKEY